MRVHRSTNQGGKQNPTSKGDDGSIQRGHCDLTTSRKAMSDRGQRGAAAATEDREKEAEAMERTRRRRRREAAMERREQRGRRRDGGGDGRPRGGIPRTERWDIFSLFSPGSPLYFFADGLFRFYYGSSPLLPRFYSPSVSPIRTSRHTLSCLFVVGRACVRR